MKQDLDQKFEQQKRGLVQMVTNELDQQNQQMSDQFGAIDAKLSKQKRQE